MSSSDEGIPPPTIMERRTDISTDEEEIDMPYVNQRRSDVSSDPDEGDQERMDDQLPSAEEEEENNEARQKYLVSSITSSRRRNAVATILFPAGCIFPGPIPIIDKEKIGHNDTLTLYYSSFVVCGCSMCKGLRTCQGGVVEDHYYDLDGLPKIEGALPPTVVKNPIGKVEPTRCVEHLQETWYSKNLARKLPTYVLSSDEEDPIEAGVRTRPQRTPVQNEEPFDLPLEDVDDMPLRPSLVHLYKPTYDRKAYGGWPTNMPFPQAYVPFNYCGFTYMIKPSEVYDAGMGLFIMSEVLIPPQTVVEPLMPFCGPCYTSSVWKRLVAYKTSMSTYAICANSRSATKLSYRIYIDGRPKLHGNIAGYINSSRGTNITPNCRFDEYQNDIEDRFMPAPLDNFVTVVPIRRIREGEELLINYSFRKPIPSKNDYMQEVLVIFSVVVGCCKLYCIIDRQM